MKRYIAFVLSLLLCCISCAEYPTGECQSNSETVTDNNGDSLVHKKYSAVNYSYMKAMWISQYDLYNVLTVNGRQRSKGDFTRLVCTMLDNVKALGINTVIVQVRPFGDSFYPSEHYPMSSYAVGAYGNSSDYDAFETIVTQAHIRGLSIHAWINPLRAMTEAEILRIDDDYAIRRWYEEKNGEYIVKVGERLYLNPAYEETRRLVCDGISEIIELYNVDGIHIDDYFYPTTDKSFVEKIYSEYIKNGGEKSLDEFRREQINMLIKEIYSTVKHENESILFGVSPSGVMKNNYELLYADVSYWCAREGYLDYICPQVYFGFEHSSCAFDKVCDEFSAMIKNDNIRLIVGMSLGKAATEYDAYAGEGKYEWRDRKDILKRSLEKVYSMDKCSGVSYFSYQYFFDPVSGAEDPRTEKERSAFLPLLDIEK